MWTHLPNVANKQHTYIFKVNFDCLFVVIVIVVVFFLSNYGYFCSLYKNEIGNRGCNFLCEMLEHNSSLSYLKWVNKSCFREWCMTLLLTVCVIIWLNKQKKREFNDYGQEEKGFCHTFLKTILNYKKMNFTLRFF